MMKKTVICALVVACGGRVDGGDGGVDAQADIVVADGASDGWTACSAPSGAIVCGGPSHCDDACPDGGTCTASVCGLGGCDDAGSLNVCAYAGAPFSTVPNSCEQCSDGNLCIDADPKLGSTSYPNTCANADYGTLYAQSGYSDYVTYADHSSFTETPIPPAPTSCPTVPGMSLCGGACGSCPTGYICMGRSPVHPYSLCVNDEAKTPANTASYCHRGQDHCWNNTPGDTGRSCFTFKVDDPSQALADQNSLCIDSTVCEAAVQGLPGGAYCDP